MKFKFSPDGGWEKILSDAASAAVAPYLGAVQGVVKDVWDDAYDHAQSLASDRLHSTVQQYLSGLKKVKSGEGIWTILLENDAVYLEEGYSGFDMIAAGLARGAKSQFSQKTGRRYVKIPFEHVQAFASKGHPMNPVVVQGGSPGATTKGDLATDLKRLKKMFAPDDTKISLDSSGSPIKGKVWSITKSPSGPQWEYREFQTDIRKRLELEKQPSSLLSGVTKVQFETGSGSMKSRYLTWRTATDPRVPAAVHDKPKWVHPGFDGVHIMKDVEQYVTDEFAKRINEIFSQGSGT